MRLISFEGDGLVRPGARLDGDHAVDLAAAGRWLEERDGYASPLALAADMTALLAEGEAGMEAARAALEEVAKALKDGALPSGIVFETGAIRLKAPLPRPTKFVCVGLNYSDHAAEAGVPLPKAPKYFAKFATSVAGPEDPIVIPRVSEQVDYEAEFAFVVGKGGKNIAKADAMSHVAGYTIVNDVSARDLQFRSDQYLAGKGCDGFGVMGPELLTPDEVPDPHALGLRLSVNGEKRQESNTKNLIFKDDDLIADMSTLWTLEPGDIIATGTPGGVGFMMKPQVWLKPGDVVRIEVDGIGVLENRVEDEA